MKKMLELCGSAFSWLCHRLHHKIEHFTLKELKKAFIKGGAPLLVIVVVWEIIEDVLFPLLFAFLGKHINSSFYALIPASWLMCLHWLVVPVAWGLWMKLKKKT